MTREEKGATRYRAMFRHYPDALTPAQVQEMLGDRQTDGLRTAVQGRDPECPHGTAVPCTQDRGH